MSQRPTFIVDCDECVLQRTASCADCVVSFILDQRDPAEALVLDLAQARAVRLLSDAGLVAPLRHRPTNRSCSRRVVSAAD